MRRFAVVLAIAVAPVGCSTPRSTMAERQANGVTKVALGAPLVIAGSTSILGAGILGVMATSTPNPAKDQLTMSAIGVGLWSGVVLAAGLPLVMWGRDEIITAGAHGEED
jgi:hypothetical protein